MLALNIETTPSDRPTLIQGSTAPLFIGGGESEFRCQHCANLLAENYDPRSLIAVDIQCFRCHSVTRTEQWPEGESLPVQLITLGSNGSFTVSSSVQMSGGVAFSCTAEIERVRSLTSAKRTAEKETFDFTPEGLKRLEVELNVFTEDEFSKWIAATRRALAAGNQTFMKCPPAWAIEHLRAKLSQGWTEPGPLDVMAIGYLHQIRHFIDRWRHHYLFPAVARSFCSEFHHAVTMLTAAAYMHDVGNNIGFTDTVRAMGRSPDLYINTRTDRRVSIEVKAPDLFFWPSPPMKVDDIEKHIHRALKSARDQLTGADGGVVIVGAGFLGDYQAVFAKAIENVASSGKVSSRIAAVAGVYHSSIWDSHSTGMLNWQLASNVSIALNPKFPGPNPVNTVR